MAKKKKKSDKIGKGTDAEDFSKGATSGAPGFSEALSGILGAFDSPDELKKKKKKRRVRAAKRNRSKK